MACGCEPKWYVVKKNANCCMGEFDFNENWSGKVFMSQQSRTLRWLNPGTTDFCTSNPDCGEWRFKQHTPVEVKVNEMGKFTCMS